MHNHESNPIQCIYYSEDDRGISIYKETLKKRNSSKYLNFSFSIFCTFSVSPHRLHSKLINSLGISTSLSFICFLVVLLRHQNKTGYNAWAVPQSMLVTSNGLCNSVVFPLLKHKGTFVKTE